MATKKKQQNGTYKGGRYTDMTYRDIKKQAVMYGMPFPEVIQGDFYRLTGFLESDRASNKPDESLIEKFDNWLEEKLKESGAEYLIKPSLRLGFISEEKKNESESKPKKEKKEKKKKKERDENNLIKGTKKSYTFELAKKGYSIERIKRRVKKKYPEASDKSIQIWYRNALSLKGVKKEKKVKEKKVREKIIIPQEVKEERKKRSKELRELRKLKREEANKKTIEYREKLENKKKKSKKSLKNK